MQEGIPTFLGPNHPLSPSRWGKFDVGKLFLCQSQIIDVGKFFLVFAAQCSFAWVKLYSCMSNW